MKRVRLIISGDVVGVGFRSFVLRYAQDFRVTGFVRNRKDQTVEIVAEGKKETLEKFVKYCRRGPDVAWVEDVNVAWLSATGEFMDFSVVY